MTPIEELSILRQLGDLLWQAIAALSTEAIDVERLRELIETEEWWWSINEQLEAASFLRQLLRIAEGKP